MAGKLIGGTPGVGGSVAPGTAAMIMSIRMVTQTSLNTTIVHFVIHLSILSLYVMLQAFYILSAVLDFLIH